MWSSSGSWSTSKLRKKKKKILFKKLTGFFYIEQGDGWTPLHLAAMMNKYDVALKLLEMGADSKTQALNGDTAQDIARKFKHYHLADVLNRYFSILFCFFFQITICTKLLSYWLSCFLTSQIPPLKVFFESPFIYWWSLFLSRKPLRRCTRKSRRWFLYKPTLCSCRILIHF